MSHSKAPRTCLALSNSHRWARLLIQQTSFTVHCLPTKENKLPLFHFLFAENKRKFVTSVFNLQQTNGSCHFLLVPFYVYSIYILKLQHIPYIDIYIERRACWNSQHWLPVIIFFFCWPRNTNFHIRFAENKRKFAVSIFCL